MIYHNKADKFQYKLQRILWSLLNIQRNMYVQRISYEALTDFYGFTFVYSSEKKACDGFVATQEWLDKCKLNKYFSVSIDNSDVHIQLNKEYINEESLDSIYTIRKLTDNS